jgi:hypothetical protein
MNPNNNIYYKMRYYQMIKDEQHYKFEPLNVNYRKILTFTSVLLLGTIYFTSKQIMPQNDSNKVIRQDTTKHISKDSLEQKVSK